MKAFGIVFINNGSYENYYSSLREDYIFDSYEKAENAVKELIKEQEDIHQQQLDEGYSNFASDTWTFTIHDLEIK